MKEVPTTVRMTELAQLLIASQLSWGERAIDATMGNGYDTLFMADQVGAKGEIYSFDIQELALERTKSLLERKKVKATVYLRNVGHEEMATEVDEQVHAIMFNLGYMPDNESRVTTVAETTIQALEMSTELLLPFGIITVACYLGHDDGKEFRQVEKWFGKQNNTLNPVLFYTPERFNAPVLLVGRKQ